MRGMFVVDCGVAAKWVLPDAGKRASIEVAGTISGGRRDADRTEMLLAEFASLITKFHRRRHISAMAGYAFTEQCAPHFHETRPLLPRALALSLEYQLSLWDCLYLALAEKYDCPVLTADRRLFRGAQGRHPAIQLVH